MCLCQTAEFDHEYVHVNKPCAILLCVRPKYGDLVSLISCSKILSCVFFASEFVD